jgi:putative chitinase
MDLSKIIPSLAPRADKDLLAAVSGAGDALAKLAAIATPLRMAHFLAQVMAETGGLTARGLVENLDYSAGRLVAVWPSRFPNLAAASPYAGNPEALANVVYAGRMGNDQTGDGWAYRGRGLLQITGRDMYQAIGNRLGIPLLQQPDLASDPAHACQVAAALWDIKAANSPADADDIYGVTRKINGGLTDISSRQAWLVLAKEELFPQPPKAAA